jgi:hypothetical protein
MKSVSLFKTPQKTVGATQPKRTNTTQVSKMVEIEINGKKTKVPSGTTILQACATVGIEIPRFCYHEVTILSIENLRYKEIVHCRKLPYVPGGSCQISKACSIVRNASSAWNESLY